MKNQDYEQNMKISKGRSALYGILSTIFLKEPTHDVLCELRNDEIRSILAEMGFNTDALNAKGSEEDFINDLEVEFTGLFVGPDTFHVFPYESVYFEKQISGTTAVKVRLFYEKYGLSMPKNVPLTEHKVLPDHIGVELQFMKLLIDKEIKAWEEGSENGAFKTLDVQREFLKKHPGRWVHLFCEKLISFTTNPFYVEFAKLTEKFIQDEMHEMNVSSMEAQV